MKKVKLAGTDRAEFELGLTQDPSEITNSGGYRLLTRPVEGGKYECFGMERVGPSGTWENFNSKAFIDLANAVLNENLDVLDSELLKKQNVFYIEVLKNVEGDPFLGLEMPMEEIAQIIDAPNPKIEEQVFLRDYAIFFLEHYPTMCAKDPDYPAKYAAAMKHWGVHVAPHNTAVDVIVKHTSGSQILFTIPGRISNRDIFNNSKGLTINEMTHEAAFIAQTNPGGAEEFLEKKLTDKLETISESERKVEDRLSVETMDDIRERYNLPRWLPKAAVEEDKPSEAVEEKTTPTNTGFATDEMGEF